MDRSRVVVAEILRPRGNCGELLAISQSDVPGRIENLKRAALRLNDGSDISVELESAWRHGDKWVLKLAGVDSISAADRFRGADLWLPLSERASLPEGEFFQTDLIGCEVLDGITGQKLGVVDRWQQYGGPPLLGIEIDGREVLIPFVSPICRTVDLEKKTIVVDLPEGLLDL